MENLTNAVLPFAKPFYLKVNGAVVLLILATIPLELYALPITHKFKLSNKYINYPMSSEHVPVGLLAIYSVLIPFVGIISCNFKNNGFRQFTAVAISGFLLNIGATMFITDVLKLLIGNFRPDFIARCIPKEGLPKNEWLDVADSCTNPNWGVVVEGCKSTPSGHSALSFAGLLFLSLVLKQVYATRFPSYVYFAPTLLAFYVAITRIIDHRHHYIDIISGSIIGSLIAYATYVFVVDKPTREDRRNEERDAREDAV